MNTKLKQEKIMITIKAISYPTNIKKKSSVKKNVMHWVTASKLTSTVDDTIPPCIFHSLAALLRTLDTLALHTHADLVKCIVQHLGCDDVVVLLSGHQGSLVDQVGQVSTTEA